MKHLNDYSDYLAEHTENTQKYSEWMAEYAQNYRIDSGIKLMNPMRTMEIVPSPDFVIESKKQHDINYNKKNKTSDDFWKYKL